MRKLFMAMLVVAVVSGCQGPYGIAGEYQKESKEFEIAFASKNYSSAVKLATTSVGKANALNAQGYQEYKSGNINLARKLYESAIENDPLQYWSYNNLGVVFISLGEFGLAISMFEKSIEINSNASDGDAKARIEKARLNLSVARKLDNK